MEILLSPRNEILSTELAARFASVTRLKSNQEVADSSEVVFIALRPDISREVIRGIKFSGYHTVIFLVPYLKFTDVFDSLANAASQMPEPDFAGLAHHAATPGGMNEAAGKEIRSKGANEAYRDAVEAIHGRFKDDLS